MISKKIDWLSVLQGWSMLLVVIGHITLTNIFENPKTPITANIERIIYSFHMPLFMFISGFLFYYTKINREKKYIETISDKMKRLGIPFCFFTLFTLMVKYVLNPLMKRPVELSPNQIISSFLYPASNPLGEMWFIGTLLIIFLFFPVFKWSLNNVRNSIFIGIVFIFLNLYFPSEINLLCISKVAYYFIYFYGGILFGKYKWFPIMDNKYLLILFISLFALFRYVLPVKLVYSYLGICTSISLCMILTHIFPYLFSSFRSYTYQIFLIGIFPQMLIRLLYNKIGIDSLYTSFYFLSLLSALYIPVGIAIIVQKLNNKYLNLCLGL